MNQERIKAAAKALCAAENIPWSGIDKRQKFTFRADAAAALAAADAVMFSGEAMEHLEHVLYAHREGALTCYDHAGQPGWCCVCGEHAITETWREHMARAVVAALKGEQ